MLSLLSKNCFHVICSLTNKEVIKLVGHLITRRKYRKHESHASVFYISRMFLIVGSVLSQFIIWLQWVCALWLAPERARFSCNDRALWKFFSAWRLFWVVRKICPRSWRNKDKICLMVKETVSCVFDCIARFVSVQHDLEWLLKRPSGFGKLLPVFYCIFLRMTLKRPFNK